MRQERDLLRNRIINLEMRFNESGKHEDIIQKAEKADTVENSKSKDQLITP